MARRRLGQAFLEAAFALAALVPLVLGIIDSGRAFWTYQAVCYAAGEGAAWAAKRGAGSTAPLRSSPDPSNEVRNHLLGVPSGRNYAAGLKPALLTIVASFPDGGSDDPNQSARVNVLVTYHLTGTTHYIHFATGGCYGGENVLQCSARERFQRE